MPHVSRRVAVPAAVVGCLFLILLQLLLLAHRNSATWDEADHTYAGYMQWKHGDFGLNAEHPPLVKFLATLPLLNMGLREPPLLDQPYRLQEVRGGESFVFNNDANAILFRARLAASLLTLLLAGIVFVATREMFGTAAGLVALALLAFDPTLLAHSALVTTDAGQACFLFWAIYAFYRYCKHSTPWRLVTVGLVGGLALSTKHSALLLFPMLILLAVAELFWQARATPSTTPRPTLFNDALRLTTALIVIAVIAVAVLWSWYGFSYHPRHEGLPLNPSMTAQLARVPSSLQGHVLALVDRLHLLPQSYTYGLAHVLIQSKAFTSSLLGTIYPHPVWFYFPVAFLIKSTLSFLILLALTVWAAATGRLHARRELTYLAVPAAVYMFFAMAGGMNIGIRHILPVYIFATVAIAGAASALIRQNRRLLYVVAALLLFQAASVLHAFPAYVAYANEAFGGPPNVHRYLSDSSADWGQQLKDVQAYVQAHNITHCWFAYFGQGVADPGYYGNPCKPLITADSLYFDAPHDVPPSIDGPVLLSAGVLSGFEFGPAPLNPYERFKALKPIAVIDYGVFVYNGHFDLTLASALSHTQKAGILLSAGNAQAALAEARQGQALAPDSATVLLTLGQALEANGNHTDATLQYKQALKLAEAAQPKFQAGTIAQLRQHLSAGLQR